MSWLAYFALAVIVTGFAAVTGFKAKNTRHVSHTHMMGVARIFLWVIVVVFVSLAVRAYSVGP